MLLRLFFLAQVLLSPCGSTPIQSPRREQLYQDWKKQRHDPDYTSYSRGTASYHERQVALRSLVQACLITFNNLAVETWLSQSTLLGWWRGKHHNPTVEISERAIFFLLAYYNTSVFNVTTPDMPSGRRYLLYLSPHARERERTDDDPWKGADARWIDHDTGLFVNVYAVRYNPSHPEGEGMLSRKDGREFNSTISEGVQAKISHRYEEMLVMEYGEEALGNLDGDVPWHSDWGPLNVLHYH
ncbi:hypothetical protein VTI74DRAFT_9949 [Chaetomium olivicolor]